MKISSIPNVLNYLSVFLLQVHAAVALSLGQTYSRKYYGWKFWLLGIICTILPDADVVSFKLGIPYEHFWGHRGFTHSFAFAAITGLLITFLFFRHHSNRQLIGYFFFFTICTASHSILDAMTTGGLGVAFFSPWDNNRYFLPWRPIQVSPIGVDNFFSEWGKRVILSELIWIGLPSIMYAFIAIILKRFFTKQTKNN